MRTLFTLLIISLFSLQAAAQNFEIPAEKYPFSKVYDWTGEGLLLMNDDPSHQTNQKFLTFVGDEPRTLWQETFVPKAENPVFLSSSGTRYLYFMDPVELDNGKFTAYQLNNAGNMKTKTCNYQVAMKKLGYDVNDLELVDIQVTDKALVHLFETYDKETKTNVLIGGFMTHHNFLTYAAEIGRWVEEENRVYYAGYEGDNIAFYQNTVRDKKVGIEFWFMTSKGEKNGAEFVEIPPVIAPIAFNEYGPCGATQLKNKQHIARSIVSFQGGKWQLLYDGNGLVLSTLEKKIWTKKSTLTGVPRGKKGYEMGVYRMREGMLVSVDGSGHFLANSMNHKSKSYSFTTAFNPSRALTELGGSNWAFLAKEHWVFMNPADLGKVGQLSLELKAK
ncbi:MAG: hypothetical protein N4A41_10340 [Crocinitomicaceae bacterium]|jgi:hypothetical protein|nr:hypothetical protein [Crocinitomicaceae bacterium]